MVLRKKGGNIYIRFIKRPMDFIISLSALVILFPLLLLIALLVRIDLGSPVLFVQKRPGLHERLFDFYKFRTMTHKTDKLGNLLHDFARLTKFGKFLRSTSLDELPELFNILKGDMSLVGPRPLLIQYLPLYNDYQRKRHYVLPGLTGLAQVNGRNSITWRQKFYYDIHYASNLSFSLDWKVIILTIMNVIKRTGINNNSCETMTPFLGK